MTDSHSLSTGEPFSSARLVYRQVNPKDDLPFYVELASDGEAQLASSPNLPRSETSETQEEFIKAIKDGFLHVVICLAPASPNAAPIPIGTMGLNRDLNPRRLHHRNASIGLRILKEYRGKGYGGEAIKWATDYCFRRAGLHKVKITYYGHNDKAGRLYVRMGFVEEGRLRDELWHDGRWWEMVQCSMLEEEYWEKVKAGTW